MHLNISRFIHGHVSYIHSATGSIVLLYQTNGAVELPTYTGYYSTFVPACRWYCASKAKEELFCKTDSIGKVVFTRRQYFQSLPWEPFSNDDTII